MKIYITILVLALLAVSCRSKRLTVIEEEPPVVIAPVEEPEPIPEPVVDEAEIEVREESFSFENKEDELVHEANTYFVIMGSFSNKENAKNFTVILEESGFSPVILLSETGYHRVSVDSYINESAARARVMQIRREYPVYNDTWLLIKQDNDY